MKTKESDSRYPQQFSSPADFPLGSPESRAAARFRVGCSPTSLLLADWRRETEAGIYEGPAMQAFFAHLEALKAAGVPPDPNADGDKWMERLFVKGAHLSKGMRGKEKP